MDSDDRSREALAKSAASQATGADALAVRRFSGGIDHYVFEATFADRPRLVVRIGRPASRQSMEAGLSLHRRLRAMGAPLPEIVAADLNHAWPHVVMERLAGSDLGGVISALPHASLAPIAAKVAEAQAIAARLPTSGRYGYAAEAEQAPLTSWSQVLDANLARSRSRIAEAGLFDQGPVDTVAALVAAARAELDAMPAVPFLHDTTTKNVIVTDAGSFSGIVDVDDLCFGDPRYAPALTLASLAASGGPVAYVAAWMSHAGHRDDRLFRLYVALFLVDFMSEHGQIFNGNQMASSEQQRANLLRAFGEAVGRVGAATG
jgi:aminoglycoside phosphotransferase (APT) family kinase protein